MIRSTTIIEKFNIPRAEGWEEILEGLVRKITGIQQGKVRTGCDFENNVFKMKIYHMGPCFCEYGKKRKEFEENNNHSSSCFHTHWKELNEAFRNHKNYGSKLKLKTERINEEMRLCRKFRIPYNSARNIEFKCTCDFEKKWKDMKVDHEKDCPKIFPNFWYKTEDIKVWWYKKFFREAYSNVKLDKEKFQEIVNVCLSSIR